MKISHGGLGLEIPDDWTDASTLLFLGPAKESTDSSKKNAREAISIHFAETDGQDAKEILEQSFEVTKKQEPSLEILEQKTFVCSLGEGWQMLQRLQVGTDAVKQYSACCVRGQLAILLTAAVSEDDFGGCQKRLLTALESLSFSLAE